MGREREAILPFPAPELPPGLGEALALLLKAHGYASELHRDPWDFAVEIAGLERAGLTPTDLRWLVCKGYVEHAAETTRNGRRSFGAPGALTFPRRTCVVLTEAGAAFARVVGRDRRFVGGDVAPGRTPFWDEARRELRLGACVVKRFRQPAPSQEAVLAAFAEEGWPPHIDDPLPPRPGQDPKYRLHSTITNLNRGHEARLLHFRADGRGQGVCWQLLS
jgi:hypothetical protein